MVTLNSVWLGNISGVQAAVWDWQPSFDITSQYSDNILLVERPEESVLGGVMLIAVPIKAETETAAFTLKPQLRSTRYDNQEQLDSNDKFLDFSVLKETQMSQWMLRGGIILDTTLTSELEDTGFVETNKQRTRWNIAPAWSYEMFDKVDLQLGMDYTQVEYEDAEFTGLVDYDNASLNISSIFEIGDKGKLDATLFGSRLDASSIDNESDSYGGQLKYHYKVTDAVQVIAAVTSSTSKTRLASAEETQSRTLANIEIDSQGEYSSWNIDLSQAIEPSGTGMLVQRDQIALHIRRELNTELSSTISINYTNHQFLQKEDINRDRKYGQLFLQLSWSLSPSWFLNGSYQFKRQEFEDGNGNAQSNEIQIGLGYRHDG